MSEEVQEGPQWLRDLEAKRIQRLKARLGHEAGAGSPCLTCQGKCPGLDLHFWRKICKNCKCGKESHDVNDDDIYSWAQFQLLGNKPEKSRKLVLPGRPDEVELEWAPRGRADLVDTYLRLLPADRLPIKNSAAALARKQTLQRQVPAHDIDPTLCHALTDAETAHMHHYVADVRQHIVGIGHLAKLNEILRRRVHPEEAARARLQDMTLNEMRGVAAAEHTLEPSSYHLRDTNYALNQIDQAHAPHARNYAHNLPKHLPRDLDNVQVPRPLPAPHLDYQMPVFPETGIKHIEGKLYENQAPLNKIIGEQGQTPQRMGNIRDVTYATHDPNRNYTPQTLNVSEENVAPVAVHVGAIKEIEYDLRENNIPEEREEEPAHRIISAKNRATPPTLEAPPPNCRRCKKTLDDSAIVITVERSTHLWHADCFKCAGCNQSLADLVYFYHKETDDVYCGRDYAKVRGIPRCKACDELIFLNEYCLAENAAFHVKHFCCYECDRPLAGSNYVMEEGQPLCVPCFETEKAETCRACAHVIKPDEQGANLHGTHFHASAACFCCKVCGCSLLGEKLLFKNRHLYCSSTCYTSDVSN